jgi:hypothetical protein
LENSQDFKDLLKTPVSSIEARSPGRAFHSLAAGRAFHSLAEDAEKLLSPYLDIGPEMDTFLIGPIFRKTELDGYLKPGLVGYLYRFFVCLCQQSRLMGD